MKKILVLLAVLAGIGCSPSREAVQVINGTNGTDGKDGSNGHSLVSQYVAATELECGSTGGNRLDIYIDMDDSLTASENDVYQNSLVACNGLNGLNGADGTDGLNGADGQAGPPGLSGPPGLNGNPGHDGLQGPQGQSGTPGAPGYNGHDGSNGSNGNDGKDASVKPKNIGASCTSVNASYDALTKNNTVELYTAGKSCAAPYKVFVLTSSASTFWISATELAIFVDPVGLRILTYGTIN